MYPDTYRIHVLSDAGSIVVSTTCIEFDRFPLIEG